ncbi:hypothetical protein [Stenotrophomonas phage BUCT603]|nr:hypothetical protein [Stenotrophomonas phage BUCT603]
MIGPAVILTMWALSLGLFSFAAFTVSRRLFEACRVARGVSMWVLGALLGCGAILHALAAFLGLLEVAA